MSICVDLEPEVEAGLLLQAQERGLSLGAYVEQLLREQSGAAITHEANESPETPRRVRRSLVGLFAPLRGMDLDFSRNQSPGRPVDL